MGVYLKKFDKALRRIFNTAGDGSVEATNASPLYGRIVAIWVLGKFYELQGE